MTPEGQALEVAAKDLTLSKAASLWQAASQQFAAGASGTVHVFINLAEEFPRGIWANTELPALVNNTKVADIVFHLIGR